MKQLLAAGLLLWACAGIAATAPAPPMTRGPATQGAALETPFFVRVLPPPPDVRERDRAAAEEREKAEKLKLDTDMVRYSGEVARDTNRMFWATVLLFAVTTGLFGVAVVQAHDSRRAVHAAVQSAEVAARAMQITEDTAERQLRAYVFMLSDGPLTMNRGGQYIATGQVKNCGQTPAHEVVCTFRIGLMPYPLIDTTDEDLPGEGSRASLAPGERLTHNTFLPVVDGPQRAALDAGQAALYVWGEVRYVDVFKKQRSSTFRWYCMGRDVVSGNLAVHPMGNDAN